MLKRKRRGEIMAKKSKKQVKEEPVIESRTDVDVDVIRKALKSCYDYFLISNCLSKIEYINEIEQAFKELEKLEQR